MKIDQIRALSSDQIEQEIAKLKKEQFNLRFQKATNQLQDTSRVRQIRRLIAKLLTVANEKIATNSSVAEQGV